MQVGGIGQALFRTPGAVQQHLPKIFDSGWLPLAAGFLVYYLMSTWNKGRIEMKRKLAETETAEEFNTFIDSVEDRFLAGKLSRVRGTAIYLAGNTRSVPMALAHNLKHNKSLHDHIIVLTLQVDEDRAIALMLAQPGMIKRPVLSGAGALLVGFKPELYAAAKLR